MTITAINRFPFRLPFAGSFKTAQGELAGREGLILQVATGAGLVGLGEATPLPEFGGGRLPDVLQLLEKLTPDLIGLTPEAAGQYVEQLLGEAGPGRAALACALDTALCDLLAQQAGLPLYRWLLAANPAFWPERVPVNATVGAATTGAAIEVARLAVRQGFSHIKLKVGLTTSIEAEIERIRQVRTAIGPACGLRLDANGGWSVQTAIEILNRVAEFNIELVEQPVAAADLAGLAAVRQATSLKIAADEPVISLKAARQIVEMKAADLLVIKPMVVGGLRPARRIIEMANSAGVECFVTTSIDSGVGIMAALHLAATLPGPIRPCGLATAALLAGTLVENLPEVQAGFVPLPRQAGLGVRLNFKELDQFRFQPQDGDAS